MEEGGDLMNETEPTPTSCLIRDAPETEFYTFIINGIILNFFGLLGVFGNVISMIILSRPQMRSSINYLLIGLARADTLLIITSILLFGLPGIYPYTGYLFTYFFIVLPHIAPVVFPLAVAIQTASVYLTVTVSVDRFVAVCHPLRARSLCTYGRARIYVIGIAIFSVLYNLPRFWEIVIISEQHPTENVTVYCPRPTTIRNDSLYISLYIHWSYFIFMYLIPFISLAVLNICIYRQVRKANRERQRLSRLQRREIGLATMLLCVVVVFFACNILPLVINIIECFSLEIDTAILDPMIKTSNLLVTINSSVNFIIYVTFGEKFQRLFLQLFCSHGFFAGTGRDSPDGGTHDDSFISNGDRGSCRFHRYSSSRNGTITRLNSGTLREKRSRTSSPAPCVYYPAKRSKANKEISAVAYTTQTSIPNSQSDWEHNCHSTSSGF